MREHFMAKLGQMRVAPVAGIRPGVRDFRFDVCRALAQHDNPAGKQQRLFHIVGHKQRGEASALPQRYEFALHRDPRQRVELAQRLVENELAKPRMLAADI